MNWLYEQVNREVDKWFFEQGRDIFRRFYLYYTNGDIKISEDAPGENYRLAMAERISPAWSKEQVKYKAVEMLRRCPCLPEGA